MVANAENIDAKILNELVSAKSDLFECQKKVEVLVEQRRTEDLSRSCLLSDQDFLKEMNSVFCKCEAIFEKTDAMGSSDVGLSLKSLQQ